MPNLREAVKARGADCWSDWHWQLQAAASLGRAMALELGWTETSTFPLRVTPYYASLLNDRDLPRDPLAIQVLPDPRERVFPKTSDTDDPFGEQGDCSPLPGLVHRYPDRLLIRLTNSCAVACRHCTRRHLLRPGGDAVMHETAASFSLTETLTYIKTNPAVREVILSGGDPLLVAETELIAIVAALSDMDQIDAIRVGTRVPVVLPMRIDRGLAGALGCGRKVWVNTQFNHPREITSDSAAACALLVDAGIPVSNQSVLLLGVNDDLETLSNLFARLQRIRVRPYYAFLGDPVAGTAHLRVPLEQARRLARDIESRLGGLALPRFVADVPGAAGKVPLERLS